MQKITALQLSRWIIRNLPEVKNAPLTHIKLQKLAFYCYGIAIAKGFEDYFESIPFEAWKHGPVSRTIYEQYKNYSNQAIDEGSPEASEIKIPDELTLFLKKILSIYGVLDSWKIRQQSHLEAPWKKAYSNGELLMDHNEIKAHFKDKFFNGEKVYGPEYVFDLSSFTLDGIPTVAFNSFDELYEAAQSIFFQDL